jgi:hypothetical protein
MLKSTFAVLTVAGTLLLTAGPAGAAITYNGHAGLGASVTDGTSNTIAFGEVIAMPDMGGQF